MFKDLFRLAGTRKNKLIVCCILAIIAFGLSLLPFFLIYLLLLELLSPSLNQVNIWKLVLLIPLCYITMFMVLMYAYHISHKTAYEILYDVRMEIGEKLTKLSLGYFNEKNTGEIKTIMNENVEHLEYFLAHHLIEVIATIVVPILLTISLYLLDWRMALASMVLIIPALFIIIINGKKIQNIIEQMLTAQSKVNATIIEYTQGIKEIKAFNQTPESFQKYQKNMTMWYENRLNWTKKNFIPFALYESFITSSILIILPIGIILYSQNALSLELFLFFLLIGPLLGMLLMRIYNFFRYWMEEKECSDRITSLLNLPILLDQKEEIILKNLEITFNQVSFTYESEKKYALQDISFCIPQGTKCALVGPSGAGKTTILKLIARFWDIYKGEILIGKYNIKELAIERLLNCISIVFQDVFLFNDTIFENIRLGNPEATEQKVKSAARAACCDEFIENLPEGYYTIIRERGVNFSEGEKQRISIARALLKDAPILLLDEAVAFLDPENENLVQEAINNLTSGKTVIIIAHRLSTIVDVDQILVMEKGKIVERGKHDIMVRNRGLYKKMWDARISTLGWEIKR